ncbi:short chain dehydrogenase/reductase oxidoreductase [Nitzschia inconspicua]|uniref:Short chain dehydrogenase/reductase oxidoreductase n=1 Tax=Nitzschia inconspicua TaxID=303405 RepID=A0A9K3L0Y3_9STRA|nr:short chain dehydrogenase/reductase oxidoreductase [Nitzschia inconspicua]
MRFFLLSLCLICSVNGFAPPSLLSPATRPSLSAAAAFRSTTALSMSNGGVVITGSAGGVGFAYAGEFMDRGYDVVICDVKDCSAAAKALTDRHPNGKVYHTKCDVSDAKSVDQLAQFAKKNLGTVNYWINNAGVNGGRRDLRDVPISQVEMVVKVNLLGTLLCTKAAMDIMGEQAGVTGHIFNTVGSGVKGGGTPGYACYGATKRGLPQLTESLVKELDEGVQGYPKKETPGKIQVHSLSPGMVFTKLLLDDSTPELRKFPFGVLAAQPEEVAADLVPKILATTTNGGSVEFLTTDRILTKFFERFVLQKKSEYIDDDGNVIKTPGAQYDELGVRSLY